jgi:hypothetical protein
MAVPRAPLGLSIEPDLVTLLTDLAFLIIHEYNVAPNFGLVVRPDLWKSSQLEVYSSVEHFLGTNG